MTKGKQISIIEIMRHIQSEKGWEGVTVQGEDVLSYTEFQNMLVFELSLTSDRRKIRELWKILTTSPVVRAYNRKADTIVIEVSRFNDYLSGAVMASNFKGAASARGAEA